MLLTMNQNTYAGIVICGFRSVNVGSGLYVNTDELLNALLLTSTATIIIQSSEPAEPE